MTVLFALALPVPSVAQEQQKEHTGYKLTDLGIFGGPSSYLDIDNGANGAINRGLNNRNRRRMWRHVHSRSLAPNCFNLYVQDSFLALAFQWQKAILTDLGVLPGGDASTTDWISDAGLIARQARNGVVDPPMTGFPETRAVLWKDGEKPFISERRRP